MKYSVAELYCKIIKSTLLIENCLSNRMQCHDLEHKKASICFHNLTKGSMIYFTDVFIVFITIIPRLHEEFH